METRFSSANLQNPDIAAANDILRKCVHCGFCTATCPSYVLLGDELDSPRGRIYQIKEMLEAEAPAPAATVKHVDRCLSCLSCMTTCPSGVDYLRLIDQARSHIEKSFRRPLPERLLRALIAHLVPRPRLFRLALLAARLVRPLAAFLPGRLGALVDLAPARLEAPSPTATPQVFAAQGKRRKRVALLTGCAQQVLGIAINEATVRILRRHGCEVVVSPSGCCGALEFHMGREDQARVRARRAIAAWTAELDGAGLDAVVVNASGCGSTVKDYGHMFRDDEAWRLRAERIASIAVDISELLLELGLEKAAAPPAPDLLVAYHDACSLQHGQKLSAPPRQLLRTAGFELREVPEGHLCCGSAGTYNMLQPGLSGRLGRRKAANLETTGGAVVAVGNLGCLVQISQHSALPVVHTVELLDWASGGPRPHALAQAHCSAADASYLSG